MPGMPQRGVSLYSYQEKFYRREMTLEDCVAAAAAVGAAGVEMLVDQMVPGYPSITYNLSQNFCAEWHDLVQRHCVKPVALDVYGETKLYKTRAITQAELLAQMVALLHTARDLHFEILRVTFTVPLEVIGLLLPYAEDAHVRLAFEVHAPHHINGPLVQKVLELAYRSGTGMLGLMPDMGIFCRKIPRLVIADALRQGATPAIVTFLENAYADPENRKDLVRQVDFMGGNGADRWLAKRIEIEVWMDGDPNLMTKLIPYILHVHGKFYFVDETLVEPEVRYEQIMPALIRGGYRGFIMSEYEGQRLTHGLETGYDEVEQVRRHQAMLANYLDGALHPVPSPAERR